MPKPRLVIVSYVVPHDDVAHAGGRYLAALCAWAGVVTEPTLLAPSTTVNELALRAAGAPTFTVLVGGAGATLPVRVANRLAVIADGLLRRWDPGIPAAPFVVGLLTSKQARAAIRAADVLDLQWFDSVRLRPLLRLLNRRARIIGTFHDVQSQTFEREATQDPARSAFWRRVAHRTRRLERAAVASLDESLAFSAKDLALLGHPATGRLVRPPLTPPSHERAPTDTPTVLFVSYLARDENDQAARWLLAEIWPLVLRTHPEAQLRLVGAGASAEVIRLTEHSPNVTITGFVPDLGGEYERAWATVTPLKLGGGVKFKVVESLLAGVPTVTTPVGAEGIASHDTFAGISDSAAGLARAVNAVISDPRSAFAAAEAARARLTETYGETQFRTELRAAWRSPVGGHPHALTRAVDFVDDVEGSTSLRIMGDALRKQLKRRATRRATPGDPIVLSYLPGQLERAVAHVPAFLPNRLRVLYVAWELDQVPRPIVAELRCADVLVTLSDYVTENYRRHLPGHPVVTAKAAPPFPEDVPADRSRWGMAPGQTVFLTVFDPVAGLDRKNPMDVLNAFQRAFSDRSDVGLYVQAKGLSEHAEADVSDAERARTVAFLRACDDDPRVRVLQETLAYRDVLSLMASCDALVALPRAEGLGLTVLEAMSLSRPTVCTAYSGILDIATPDSTLLVPYELRPVPFEDEARAWREQDYVHPPRWAHPDVQAAAKHLRMLADDPLLREEIGRRAAARATEFREACDEGAWVREVFELLDSSTVREAHVLRETALRAQVKLWRRRHLQRRRAVTELRVRTRLGRVKRDLIALGEGLPTRRDT